MKQVVITIPDNKYLAFINHIKSRFADIEIRDRKLKDEESLMEDDNDRGTILLSEKSLAEDWLSDEDNRWDQVL